jgi:ABC-2 type transport system permease protein
MIFTAFYHSTTEPQPMTLRETINYIWLGQAMFLLMPWNMDRDVAKMIRTGDVGYEMVRPVSLFCLWFARAMAMRMAPVLLRAVPMFPVAGLFLGLEPPASAAAACAFAVSVVGAILLSSAFTVLITVSLFWTISGEGIIRLVPGMVMLFSGMLVPLPLFPDWAQPILNILPFRGIIDVPFRLYMGHLPATEAPVLIGQQLLWLLVIAALGRLVMGLGVRRLVVQGG